MNFNNWVRRRGYISSGIGGILLSKLKTEDWRKDGSEACVGGVRANGCAIRINLLILECNIKAEVLKYKSERRTINTASDFEYSTALGPHVMATAILSNAAHT
jgi:hypothetical protein